VKEKKIRENEVIFDTISVLAYNIKKKEKSSILSLNIAEKRQLTRRKDIH